MVDIRVYFVVKWIRISFGVIKLCFKEVFDIVKSKFRSFMLTLIFSDFQLVTMAFIDVDAITL